MSIVLFSALSVESGAMRRKGEAMSIRKTVDYPAMFAALDALMVAQPPQMELYCEIGRVVSSRAEKGAAVAASEYLQAIYPAAEGFSPRNVRRMRGLYRMYGDTPELLVEAMRLNWTQNGVIMETELTMGERCWYIRKAAESGLSKKELLRMIESAEHSEIALGENEDACYTVEKDEFSEKNRYEEYPVYLPRQYLPQPHGRVRDEGLGAEGRAVVTISYRIGGHQPGGDRQPDLSSGTAQAGRAWDLLRRPCRTAVDKSGLRRIRSPDRHGPSQPPGYVPHLRRRLCRKDVPPDGPHRSSRQCGGPMVHRGLRGDLAGCAGWLPRTFERILITLKGGRKVAITEKVIGVIADIGIDVAKEHFENKRLEAKAKEKLSEYLTRQEKYNFDCSLEEEIDFEGLAEYIHNDLIDDVKIRLFGRKQERRIAREAIADKAACYAQAKTKLSKERAKHLAVTAVDILRGFFRSKIDCSTLFAAAEIEDTVIDEMSEQHKAQDHKIDALAKNIQDNSLLSIDKNVSLANSGKIDTVEKNAAAFFAALGTAHVLTPYYGFTMDGVSCLKSIPLRPDAVELYPPHFEVTATAFKMGGTLLPNVDASTFTRAYRTQSPIEFDVTTAQKYLGNVLDPIQHEAENLTGTHVILKPPTFPPAFPCSVFIDGELVIAYLLLRTKKIEDDGTIVITNEEQKNFNFMVTLEVNTSAASLNLSITPNSPPNVGALNYRRFLKKASSANCIELKDLEHNATFISSKANLVPHNFENLDSEIEFLEKIVAIENHFHISLTIPEEIEISDHQVINRLYSMIQDGKYCGSCSGFTMSFNLTEELRQSIRTIGETACGFSCSLGMQVELFGRTLDSTIIRKIDSMRIDNYEKISKKLDALDEGDPIKVPFISSDTDRNIHYSDMFYSDETAREFLGEATSEVINGAGGENDVSE